MPDRLWHTTDQELRTLIAHHLRLAASNLGALVPGGTADIPREVLGRLRGDLRLKAEDVLAHRTGLMTGHMGSDPSVPPVYSSIVPIGFGVHQVTLHVRDTDVDLPLGFVPSVWLARVVADRAVDALTTLLVRTRLVDEPRRCRGLRTVVGPVPAKVSPRPSEEQVTAAREQLGMEGQPADDGEPLSTQITRLAEAVMLYPGEPSRSEGAIDAAIRLLRRGAGFAVPQGPPPGPPNPPRPNPPVQLERDGAWQRTVETSSVIWPDGPPPGPIDPPRPPHHHPVG